MRILVKIILIGLLLGSAFMWGYFTHRSGAFPRGLVESWFPKPEDERTVMRSPTGADSPMMNIPYLDRAYDPRSEDRGVIHHVAEAAQPGLNFYNSRNESRAALVDMDGEVVHEWTAPTERWQYAALLPSGDVVVLVKDKKVLRLDRDSKVLWSHPVRAHHDLWVADDGAIWVLAREAEPRTETHPDHKVVEDFLLVLTPDGTERERISIWDAFVGTPYEFLLPNMSHREIPAPEDARAGQELDIFHTNYVEAFDGSLAERSPLLKRGNILVCVRNINSVAILDGKTKKAVWVWGVGNLTYPHHPTLIANGNLLVFNNGTEASQVLEVDPATREIVWKYAPGKSFFSYTRGSNQRLANGNTLITESDKGYVLEVTREGRIVWHFANPDVNEKGERSPIFRMTRFAAEDLPFLK